MSEPTDPKNPVIFTLTPKKIDVTARDFGQQLACDTSDKQAAILTQWAEGVLDYSATESWPMQCREIAECMSDEECFRVQHMLSALTEHLDAVPQERRSKATANSFCDNLTKMLETP